MTKSNSRRSFVPLVISGVGLILIGVVVTILLSSQPAETAAAGEAIVPLKVEYDAPALALDELGGEARSLKDLRGQVVLVNLWATWCPPCREEMPTLQAFYEKYKEQGFTIIGVNDGDPQADVEKFVGEYQLTFPIWMDPKYSMEELFNTINLPSSYVIDRDGVVRLQWVGEITRKMLDKYVVPIIEG